MFEKIDEPIAATVSGDGTVVVGITEEEAANLDAPSAPVEESPPAPTPELAETVKSIEAKFAASPRRAPTSEELAKFGMWAHANIVVDGEKNTVYVGIDDPMPDDDAAFFRTSIPKAAQIITRKVAGTLLATGPEMKFFESP